MQATGGRIRYLREKMGVTITEVAQATGVAKSNISCFENNKSKPSADALIRLSYYFNVTSDWILKGDSVLEKERFHPQASGSPPSPDEAHLEYLNLYELELIQNYRKLAEREQGKVDQFVNSLPAREVSQEDGKKQQISSDLMNGSVKTAVIMEEPEADKEPA